MCNVNISSLSLFLKAYFVFFHAVKKEILSCVEMVCKLKKENRIHFLNKNAVQRIVG